MRFRYTYTIMFDGDRPPYTFVHWINEDYLITVCQVAKSSVTGEYSGTIILQSDKPQEEIMAMLSNRLYGFKLEMNIVERS